MESIQDTTNSSESTQSFGIPKWQRKKSRYEIEEFIVAPHSEEEGGGFQLRYGKISAPKSSTPNKNTQKCSEDTQGTASSVLSYLGLGPGNRRPSIGEVGGAIAIDASGGFSFDDFSKQPDPPSVIPHLNMSDLTLEAQLFPQADPLITVAWPWRKHSLARKTTSTYENPSMSSAPDYDPEEGKIVQSVKNLNITAKVETYTDRTTQYCENITLDTPKTLYDNHPQVKEKSPIRERKRSGLEVYVSSIANQTSKSHHFVEDEEGEKAEEDEKASEVQNNEMLYEPYQPLAPIEPSVINNKENKERASEFQNNDILYEPYQPLALIEPAVINHKENKERASDVQNNDILYEPYQPLALLEPAVINDKEKKERASEAQNNDIQYEPYQPLAQLEPVVINVKENKERASDIQNNDIQYEPYQPLAVIEPAVISDREKEKTTIYTNDNNTESPEVNCELKAGETVKLTKEEGSEHKTPIEEIRERKTSNVIERKTSLLALVSPFIPFKESSAGSDNPMTPKGEVIEQGNKSKAVNRFFCTEGYKEHTKSNNSESNDLVRNSEQLKSAESSISNDIAPSSKPKVKRRRPKASALREMNVWGPSSM